MSIEENKDIVRRFFELGPSSGDMNAANALLDQNFDLHTPLPLAPGIQGINDVVTACRAAFEHLNVTVEDIRLKETKSPPVSLPSEYTKANSWACHPQASQ